jgi:hypothetical protein
VPIAVCIDEPNLCFVSSSSLSLSLCCAMSHQVRNLI